MLLLLLLLFFFFFCTWQDGVDVDSCDDVLIADSTIACGDDNVVLKSGLGAAGTAFNVPTRNVLVRNVSCLSGEGIAIGSEVAGGIFNATFQNMTIANMNRAMSIKGCADMPIARVENVTFRDIVFYNVVVLCTQVRDSDGEFGMHAVESANWHLFVRFWMRLKIGSVWVCIIIIIFCCVFNGDCVFFFNITAHRLFRVGWDGRMWLQLGSNKRTYRVL